MSIRSFMESDLDACAALFVETFGGAPWNEVWPYERARLRIEQIVRTPMAFGAVALGETGELVGFVLGISEPWNEGSHFFVREMCVRPDVQRGGIGARLMDFLLAEAQARGDTRVYLLTARGESAEAFYTKRGFYTSPRMILMARRFDFGAGPRA